MPDDLLRREAFGAQRNLDLFDSCAIARLGEFKGAFKCGELEGHGRKTLNTAYRSRKARALMVPRR